MEFNLAEINPTVSRVKVKIAYDGKNRRKFDISKEVFDDMDNTLKGTPILAFYSEKVNDVLGHEGDLARTEKGLLKTGKPTPFGFVCPVTEPFWEEFELPDGTKKDYKCTYAYLWKTRYPKEVVAIEKSGQSMEIRLMDVEMVDGYITPNKAQYIGLTALGEGVTPTFEGSGFEKFSTDDNDEEYNKMYKSTCDQIEFSAHEESKMSIEWVNDLVEEISEIYGYDCTDEDATHLFEEFEECQGDGFALPDKYNGIKFKPPLSLAKEAQSGLDMRARQSDSNKCCTPVGLARARQLINRQELSPSTVKRMKSFFDRHKVDKKSDSWKSGDSKGEQAWKIWGGEAGYRWAKKIVAQMDKADEVKEDMSFAVEHGVGETIEVSTDKNKAIDGEIGEKNVQELKNRVVKASNYKELIPKVFLKHPSNLNDFTLDELGYPVMYFREDKLYYHLGFIKGASSRLEQQKDQPYYSKVKSRLVSVRKKVGMPAEFSMEGDARLMEQNMMKEMFMKYGMDKYMFMKMDDTMMYAMDMEEMKPMAMPYAMNEGMAEPMMDDMKMAEDMMMNDEEMVMLAKTMYDMYMAKIHGYMSLQTEKEEADKSVETFKLEVETEKGKVEKLNEEMEKFTLLKTQIDAGEILKHEDFSMLTEADKAELIKKVEANMEMETFKLHAEAFSFKKLKDMPKTEQKTEEVIEPKKAEFSMDLPQNKKKEKEVEQDIYKSIKQSYNFK